MHQRILITGSCGLIGRAVSHSLRMQGHTPCGLDLLASSRHERGDVTDLARVREAVEGVDGVLHLAAVSRVVTAERDPARCQRTNIDGTGNILTAAMGASTKPWVVVASSREVYGQVDALPVNEEARRQPLNVYARSKCAAEDHAAAARSDGLCVSTVRFSNVYGSAHDHTDRVVPAFARAALTGAPLRVEGRDHLFDFTHVDDVARALLALVHRLCVRADVPQTIQFVSGVGTTLGELASLAIALSDARSPIVEAPARDFDVARFVGDPTRALRTLGWRAEIPLRDGLARLLRDLRAEVSR